MLQLQARTRSSSIEITKPLHQEAPIQSTLPHPEPKAATTTSICYVYTKRRNAPENAHICTKNQ